MVHADRVKRVADFVRYQTNLVRRTQLTEFTEREDFEFVASLSMESGFQRQWKEHDTAAIVARFQNRSKVNNKKEILHISNDEVLSHILEREGHLRCYEKVKSLYKQGAL